MLFAAGTFSLNYLHLWNHLSGGTDYFVVGHYWTLALEEQFYLTWPLLMLLFARNKLVVALTTILVLAPFLRIGCYYLTPGSRGQIAMMFHTGFDSIAAGVLLGELLRRARPRHWLERLAANRMLLAGAIAFVALLSPYLEQRFHGAYSITIGKPLELACLCLVVTAAVSFPGTLLFRFLNWRPLVFVGVLSYSLYVWNNLFLYSAGRWPANQFPLNFLCVGGMALASHYLVERPFLKLKNHLHQRELPCRSSVKQSYA
jgi:peptidoglycan/LPS O-acetylase OafA/YrhL